MTSEKNIQSSSFFCRQDILFYLGILVLSALLLYARAYVGWIPWDDGTLGQAAQRVLYGEMPHVDFDENYTGGVTYFHALMFSFFGESVKTIRSTILSCMLLAVIPLFAVLRTLASRTEAMLYFAVILLFSLAFYLSALPSWYNALFAILSIAAVLSYIQHAKTSFLFLAGVFTGFSFLAKIAGLYLLAGLLLFCLFDEQSKDAEEGSSAGFRVTIIIGLLVLAAIVFLLLAPVLDAAIAISFLLPCLSSVALLIWREFHCVTGTAKSRIIYLAKLIAPIIMGFFLPVSIFLLSIYSKGENFKNWFNGVFIAPQNRYEHLAILGVDTGYIIFVGALLAVLTLVWSKLKDKNLRVVAGGVWIFALVLLPYFGSRQELSVRMILFAAPIFAAVTSFYLLARCSAAVSTNSSLSNRNSHRQLFLAAAVASFHGLIQFPYFNPTYHSFAIPTAVILFAALANFSSSALRSVILVTLVGLIPLGIKSNIDLGMVIGKTFAVGDQQTLLESDRGGYYLSPRGHKIYSGMLSLIADKSKGNPIFAGPDCPEVYFLAGSKNLTRTFFDFLDEVPLEARFPSLLKEFETQKVSAVVINRSPNFSGFLPANVENALEELFPFHKSFARYEVRWREL